MKERSIFFNSFWGVLSQLIRGGIGLALIPYMVSRVGLANYGLFSAFLLMTLYQGLVALLDVGYPAFLLNQIARKPGDQLDETDRKSLGALTSYLLIISALLLIVALMAGDWVLGLFHIEPALISEYRLPFLLILIANFFSIPTLVCGVIWIAKHRNAQFKQIDTFGYVVFILLVFSLLAFSPSFTILTVAFFCSQLLMGLMVLYKTARSFGYFPLPGRIEISHLRKAWPEWSPFFFARVNGTAQRQSDVTLVSFILGPSAVAVYDISLKIPSLIKGLLGKISEVVTPLASLKREVKHNAYFRQLAENLCNLQMALILAFWIAFVCFARKLLGYWLGPEFEQYSTTLVLAAFFALVTPHNSILGSLLIARGQRNRQMSFWPTTFSLLSIVASIPMTWMWGVSGTILATVFQFLATGILFVIWAYKDFDFNFWSGWKNWLISIGIAGSLHLLAYQYVNEAGSAVAFFSRVIALEVLCFGLLIFVLRKDFKVLISQMRVKASSLKENN